jgi:hypothetical protein
MKPQHGVLFGIVFRLAAHNPVKFSLEKMKGENKDENQIAQMDNDRDYLHNNPGIWLCMVNWR